MAQTFAVIPPRVTTLNLCGNDFWKNNAEELTWIFKAIPKNVMNVSLSVQELNQMTPE
ncbi:hypothetical protein [Legionella sainthelensi]|uniref:hypothetical protein n=1 Tax=Legionella sainthelensi TaxID=28087 RepID=UPI00135A791D|nr:hypothetical protein [Legionella sainthelensi]